MNKKLQLWFAFLVILFASWCSLWTIFNNSKKVWLNSDWRISSKPYSSSVVCELKVSATNVFREGNIISETNIEEKPMRLTFVDIDSENPSIIGNLWDKSPLTKIDNWKIIYLIENTAFGNMNIFTLFRDKNIMILSKQYDLLWTPFWMVMMGDCLSGTE